MLTKLQFVSWKLPLVIVRQLSGVNERVVVSFSGLNDLPAHFVSWFLEARRVFDMFQYFFFSPQNRLTESFVDSSYLFVFVEQEAQQH